MSSFTEAVVVAPSIGILTYFKDATSATKISTHTDTFNPKHRLTEENLFRLVEEKMAINISVETDVNQQIWSTIDDSSRSVAWKYFLKAPESAFSSNEYSLACQGEHKLFDKKIRDDSFRTFKSDDVFWSRVKEDALIRVLNALSAEFGYVQGMNVLLGPFMYTMSEQESFYCMRTLLRHHIPRYVLKNLDGAQDGAKIFAKCLRAVDPKLYAHIIAKIPDLSIFALKYVLTLFANAKPLEEVIKLWDATFAIGPHFNILLLCAKLMLIRDSILKEKRGAKIMLLIEESPVVSGVLIDGALCLLKHIPHELMKDLRTHALLSSASASTAPHCGSPASGLKHYHSESTACTSGADSRNTSGTNSHNSSTHSIDLHAAGLHSPGRPVIVVDSVAGVNLSVGAPCPDFSSPQAADLHHQNNSILKISSGSTEKSAKSEKNSICVEQDHDSDA